MNEPTYTLIVSDADRQDLARVLGKFMHMLATAKIFVEAPSGGTQSARAVLSPPSQSPAAAPPVAIEPRDRWARDRRGKELPMPEGYVARELTVWKTEQKPPKKVGGKPYLKVTWQSQDRGYVDANCFDEKLFPWIINAQGRKATLYLVKSGQYLNVVGVRA